MKPTTVWTDPLLTDPHTVADKRRRVQKMFAAIAPAYDLNNRVHSLWMDQRWRSLTVKLAQVKATDEVVDVACGTGDLSIAFARHEPRPARVIGIDFTFEMLPLARGKARDILWVNGDAQSLPLADQCCDIVSIAFGLRNVADPAAAIHEFHRILRPGGRLLILEFSLPSSRILRWMYNIYFQQVLPRTATLISRDTTGAYKYLPKSVHTFLDPPALARMLSDGGFSDITQHSMTFGIAVCHRAVKSA